MINVYFSGSHYHNIEFLCVTVIESWPVEISILCIKTNCISQGTHLTLPIKRKLLIIIIVSKKTLSWPIRVTIIELIINWREWSIWFWKDTNSGKVPTTPWIFIENYQTSIWEIEGQNSITSSRTSRMLHKIPGCNFIVVDIS